MQGRVRILQDSAYLNLLKLCLTAAIYNESAWQLVDGPMPHEKGLIPYLKRKIVHSLKHRGLRLVRTREFDRNVRDQGLDWPLFGFTMVGIRRLDNLQSCIEDVLANDVPGCFVETGVWRGGGSIFAKAVFEHHGAYDRIVWCCDSFQGMPPPSSTDLSIDRTADFSDRDYLIASEADVANNFKKFGLLDDNVRFLKGWFCDTLPTAPIGQIAILRIDGDLYESTMDSLKNLYPKLSRGGYLIVDDYKSWKGCRTAVDEFRQRHGITNEIIDIDAHAIYWQRASLNSS
jgi:O-methyltransferase